MSRTCAAVTLLSAAITLTGCDLLRPDVGEVINGACENEDSDPTTNVSFKTDIVQGFVLGTGECMPCHDPEYSGAAGFFTGGLSLASYESLMAGGTNSGTNIIVPGVPCDSVAVHKLSAGPPFGSRMPYQKPALPSADIQILKDWIAEGALNN